MRLNNFGIENYFPWLATTTPGEQAFIADGKNFLWTSSGVRSAWGTRQVWKYPYSSTPYECPHVTCLCDEIHVLLDGKVYDSCGRIVFEFPERFSNLDCKYRWSETCVGCDTVFSHPHYGLILWSKEEGWREYYDAGWSSAIFGIGELDNRLLVQLKDVVVWSAMDLPTQYEYTRKDGSGYQSSNLAKFGKPLGIVSLRNSAFAFTSNGIMSIGLDTNISYDAENRPTVGAMRFQFDCLTADFPAASPCAHTAIDKNAVVWFSEKGQGLYTLGQNGPTQWLPELGNWLSEVAHCKPEDFCMDYVGERDSVIMRYDDSSSIVYQVSLEKFGRLDYAIDQFTCCGGKLFAICQETLLQVDDNTLTSDSFIITSALRLPLLNAFDRPTREFHVDTLEIYQVNGSEIREGEQVVAAYDVDYAPSCDGSFADDRHCRLTPTKVSRETSTFSVDLQDLYHRVRIIGSYHIAGFQLNGRYAGKT